MSVVASQKLSIEKLSIDKRTIRSLTDNETDAVAGGTVVVTIIIISAVACLTVAMSAATDCLAN